MKKSKLWLSFCLLAIFLSWMFFLLEVKPVEAKTTVKEKTKIENITIIKICVDGRLFLIVQDEKMISAKQIFINDCIPATCIND